MIFETMLLTIRKNSSVGVECSVSVGQVFYDHAINMLCMSTNDNKYSCCNKNYIFPLRANSCSQLKPPKKKTISSKINDRSIAKNHRYRRLLPFLILFS